MCVRIIKYLVFVVVFFVIFLFYEYICQVGEVVCIYVIFYKMIKMNLDLFYCYLLFVDLKIVVLKKMYFIVFGSVNFMKYQDVIQFCCDFYGDWEYNMWIDDNVIEFFFVYYLDIVFYYIGYYQNIQ